MTMKRIACTSWGRVGRNTYRAIKYIQFESAMSASYLYQCQKEASCDWKFKQNSTTASYKCKQITEVQQTGPNSVSIASIRIILLATYYMSVSKRTTNIKPRRIMRVNEQETRNKKCNEQLKYLIYNSMQQRAVNSLLTIWISQIPDKLNGYWDHLAY